MTGQNKRKGATITEKWKIFRLTDFKAGYDVYKVECRMCGEAVLYYQDGKRLKALDLIHCANTDRFYIARQLNEEEARDMSENLVF